MTDGKRLRVGARLVCERWDKFHVVLVPLERYASVGLSEKPEVTLLLRAASSSDFPSENQHSALILTAGRFTSVGEEREAILEICMQVLLSECKTRSLVERVRIVNLHYLFPASVPK